MLVSVIVDLEMFLSNLILSCKLYFNLGQRFHFKYHSTKITGVPLPKNEAGCAAESWHRDLPKVANAHTSVTSASTAGLSSSLARHEFTHSSNLPFQCVECQSKCDEGDDCSKTSCQPTRGKRVHNLNVVLLDSFTFV